MEECAGATGNMQIIPAPAASIVLNRTIALILGKDRITIMSR
jgi:soluble lytic murein transglycosylase-like protein